MRAGADPARRGHPRSRKVIKRAPPRKSAFPRCGTPSSTGFDASGSASEQDITPPSFQAESSSRSARAPRALLFLLPHRSRSARAPRALLFLSAPSEPLCRCSGTWTLFRGFPSFSSAPPVSGASKQFPSRAKKTPADRGDLTGVMFQGLMVRVSGSINSRSRFRPSPCGPRSTFRSGYGGRCHHRCQASRHRHSGSASARGGNSGHDRR